jgi:glutaredoxin 3
MITVYSQANCPGCLSLKQRLKAKGIEFSEVRIDLVREAKDFVLRKGHRSVPVVYKDDVHVADIESLFEEKT